MNSLYSDTNSIFKYDPADYIDLETALVEEDLCTLSHSPVRNYNYDDYDNNNYRFSLKSIDSNELDRYRRSLLTPMPTKTKSPQPTQQQYDNNKRSTSNGSPNSYPESVAESVALFKNLNENTSDFTQSLNSNELDHFPRSLISPLSSSNKSTQPPAQQYDNNRGSPNYYPESVLECDALSGDSNVDNDNYRINLKSMDSDELDRYRRSLLTPTTSSNKPPQAAQQRHDIHTKSSSPPSSYSESVVESVALFNNLNDYTTDFVTTDLKYFTYDMDDLVSSNTPSPQHMRYEDITRRNASSVSASRHHLNQQKGDPSPADNDNKINSRTTNLDKLNNVTPPSSSAEDVDKRHRSSYNPTAQYQDTATTNLRKLANRGSEQQPRQLLARRASNRGSLLIDNKNLKSDTATKDITTSSKYTERRASVSLQPQRKSLLVESKVKVDTNHIERSASTNHRSSQILHQKYKSNDATRNFVVTASQRNSLILEPKSKLDNITIADQFHSNTDKHTKSMQRNNLVVSRRSSFEEKTTHDLEKRTSHRNSIVLERKKSEMDQHTLQRNSVIIEKKEAEQQQQKVTVTSRYAQRRSSHQRDITANADHNKQSVCTATTSDVATSNRYGERRSSLQRINEAPTSTVNERATYYERYTQKTPPSIIPVITNTATEKRRETILSNPTEFESKTLPGDLTASNHYVDRRRSSLQQTNEAPTSTANKRASYHEGYKQKTSPSIIPVITNTAAEKRSKRTLSNPTEESKILPRSFTTSNRYVERRSSDQSLNNKRSATTINKRASYHEGYSQKMSPSIAPVVTSTEKRRARALSNPSTYSQYEKQYEEQQTESPTLKPSLMPAPTFRYRKHSNNSLSRYASVPENEVAPTTKEVRFSFNNSSRSNRASEDIQPTASRSTGGYSNSTTSSSYSGGYDDPPTPPSSYIVDTIPKRSAPAHSRTTRLLEKLKDNYGDEQEPVLRRQRVTSEESPVTYIPRRQRVASEENENYRSTRISALLARAEKTRERASAYISHR